MVKTRYVGKKNYIYIFDAVVSKIQFIKSSSRIDTQVVACQKKLLSGVIGLLVPLLGLAHPTAEALSDLTAKYCCCKASTQL